MKQGWMRGATAAEERVLPEPMTYGIARASKTQSSGPDGRKLNDRGWKLERPLPLIDRQCADPSLLFPVRMILHNERGRKLRESRILGLGVVHQVQPREALRAQDSTLAGRFETLLGRGKRTRLSWRTSAQSAADMRSERRVSSQLLGEPLLLSRRAPLGQRMHFLVWLKRQSSGRNAFMKPFEMSELLASPS